MLCIRCGEPTSERPCGSCGREPLLDGRYRLLEVVGHGAIGTTYRAEHAADGAVVAIKELLVRRLDTFKTQALFEREAEVLRTLDHPGVPRYIEHLVAGTGKRMGFYLVQEFIEGRTLAAEVAARRPSEREVVRILLETLEILAWLHALRPPVIHRDLKPGNLMRRHGDGRLVLIDFGSVRDAVHDPELGGSTVTGTYGYMAPEQFAGRATPGTDLYALGAMAVGLLTGQEPQVLAGQDHLLRWRGQASIQPALAAVLDDLLQPDPARRPADARGVARRLQACLDPSLAFAPGAAAAPQARRAPPPISPDTQGVKWPELPPLPPGAVRTAPPARDLDDAPARLQRRRTRPTERQGEPAGTLHVVLACVALGLALAIALIAGFSGTSILWFATLTVSGLVLMAEGLGKVKKGEALWSHGVLVPAKVTFVARDGAELKVVYEFTVDGRVCRGSDRLYLDAAIRPGDTVDVLYDSSNPADNVLCVL